MGIFRRPFQRLLPVVTACSLFVLLGASGSSIKVPYETPISVHVRSQLSSADAHVGDKVSIEVVDDVAINGFVVFAKGADGSAEVSSVTPAAANTPGQIELAVKWLHCVDGSKIGVTGQLSSTSGGSSTTAASGPSTSDVQNAINSAGVNSAALNQAQNVLGRVKNVFGSLTAHAKGAEGAIGPDRKFTVSVRNPAGVVIVSTVKSTGSDDSDVK